MRMEMWLNEAKQALGGDWSLYLEDGVGVRVIGERVLPAASLIKVPLALVAADRWHETLTLMEEDRVAGEGTLQWEPPGSRWPVSELVERMLTVSDNAATNVLIRELGLAHINRRLAGWGLAHTRLNRPMMAFALREQGMDNWTTPREMGGLFRRMERGQLPHGDRILAVLERQRDREKIPSGLPAGVRVANKPGELPHLRHDVALIWGRRGTLVLGIFAEGIAETGADKLMATLTGHLYAAWEANGINML